MRFPLHLAVSLIFLTGCAASSTKLITDYRNFSDGVSPAHEKQMANDAAHQLQLLYPPASTRLQIRAMDSDAFGKHLAELLRAQGYALLETSPPKESQAGANKGAAAADAPDPAISMPFNYVLDKIASPKLYRVTLILGTRTISRAYVPQSEIVYPAGAWVRKE